MTVAQELRSIKDKLILAHIEVCAIEEDISMVHTEDAQKLLNKIKKLKEELEGCI